MITPDRLRHLMWYAFAGTKGGNTRIKMIKHLKERPYNAHQLSKALGVDYRTILHHVKILLENQFIHMEGKKYGEMYFITDLFKTELKTFEEIVKKLGDSNK